MKVLITGVHSIAGAFLVEKLGADHTIIGMDHTAKELDGVEHVFHCSEFSKLPEVDAVIHVAGKDEDTIDWSKSLEYMESNLGLTRCIFEWFKKSKARQFYYLSSIKVLGNQTERPEMTEDMQPLPFGPLGESKYMVEQYLQEQWLLDKKVYILRTSFLHGQGLFCNDNSKRLYRWVKRGIPYIFGSFDCRRSFTSLDNLQFVLAQMLQRDLPGGVYHTTDDNAMSSNDFYRLIGRSLGQKVRIWHMGKGFFKLAATVSGWFNGYFDRFEYRKLTMDFVADNTKLKHALGMESMPFPLVEGLEKSVREFDKNERLSHE